MNVNNGAHAQQYTECLSAAAAEDAAVPVTPVCRYLYNDDVVHYFVEAPGANLHNVTVTINLEPMELIIDAAVQREHRLDRLYLARIQMDGYDFILENTSYRVSNGEIHVWFPFVFNGPQVSPPRSPL